MNDIAELLLKIDAVKLNITAIDKNIVDKEDLDVLKSWKNNPYEWNV